MGRCLVGLFWEEIIDWKYPLVFLQLKIMEDISQFSKGAIRGFKFS